MTAAEIVRRRLAGQLLTGARPTSAIEVVRTLGAVQAQEYAATKWALALRTRGSRDSDIEKDLDAGRIIRTHLLRPTWHMVTPDDLRWMLMLTGPRVIASSASYHRRLELDDAVFRRSRTILERALAGGGCLTRRALNALFVSAGMDTRPNRLAHILMHAELKGLICSGPRRGRDHTYMLLEERVPPVPSIDRDEALLRLATRYFTTRGPATARDFAWWSGLTMADARRALEIAAPSLQRSDGKTDTHWWALACEPLPRSAPTAHLLPIYDEYFIGLRDRTAILQRLADAHTAIGSDASVAHFVFMDGQLVARWKVVSEKAGVRLAVDPLSRISAAARRRIGREVGRYGEFLGKPVELAIA
ncbi:MAG: winged helix DNA-binding domain-containing protein [Gemmatimonadetes bacterium]|nr:winged helix DNA-binding domain-containing protein [Gemmatimonadota bacterium]